MLNLKGPPLSIVRVLNKYRNTRRYGLKTTSLDGLGCGTPRTRCSRTSASPSASVCHTCPGCACLLFFRPPSVATLSEHPDRPRHLPAADALAIAELLAGGTGYRAVPEGVPPFDSLRSLVRSHPSAGFSCCLPGGSPLRRYRNVEHALPTLLPPRPGPGPGSRVPIAALLAGAPGQRHGGAALRGAAR
jgi:hypothetical protein